ncbi:hypothetical protein NPIL_637261 [Nephila pilipes]|uniref:Uncharacterized protein n=1 Tax=Nephila pilipes TaxID=299642 RepID=A0A8X6MS60_NEPPI|nr:hypothetical protein NPIL_637261 [Nephila pilipes]
MEYCDGGDASRKFGFVASLSSEDVGKCEGKESDVLALNQKKKTFLSPMIVPPKDIDKMEWRDPSILTRSKFQKELLNRTLNPERYSQI